MRIVTRSFIVPKTDAPDTPDGAGGEDALWPPADLDLDCRCFTLAVCDGAGSSFRPGPWAGALARAVCRDALHQPERLQRPRTAWHAMTRPDDAAPWWVKAAYRRGAAAVCTHLRLTHPSECDPVGTYRVEAIGDACLVHTRGDNVLATWPYQRSDEFDRRPHAVHTDPANDHLLPDHTARLKGRWRSGDTFLLMTDALACWFYQRLERGEAPWRQLRAVGRYAGDPRFAEWVRRQQRTGALADDDVTLRTVTILTPESAP